MNQDTIKITSAYQSCFSTDSGKIVLDDLKKILNFDLSVVPKGIDGHIDVYEVMRNEGKRAMIIHILKKMTTDLDSKAPELIKQEQRYI